MHTYVYRAAVYENPNGDTDLSSPNLLTAVALDLSNTFVSGFDCGLDGVTTCTSDGVRATRPSRMASIIA